MTYFAICDKMSHGIKYERTTLLTPKIRFPCVWYHAHVMHNVP